MVGQKQPQSHVKREDQGSPQTGRKQRGRQEPPKPVVLSTPAGEKDRIGLHPPASEPPPVPSSPCPSSHSLPLAAGG